MPEFNEQDWVFAVTDSCQALVVQKQVLTTRVRCCAWPLLFADGGLQ